MTKLGKMTQSGLEKLALSREGGGQSEIRRREGKGTSELLPADLTVALSANKEIEGYFNHLAPSHRRMYIKWITSAKKEETRKRRIVEALNLMAQKKKLGLK